MPVFIFTLGIKTAIKVSILNQITTNTFVLIITRNIYIPLFYNPLSKVKGTYAAYLRSTNLLDSHFFSLITVHQFLLQLCRHRCILRTYRFHLAFPCVTFRRAAANFPTKLSTSLSPLELKLSQMKGIN